MPNHGFARTSLWKHIKTVEISDEETEVYLELNSSEASLKLWPYHFKLEYKITVAKELKVSLTTTNIDAKAFNFTEALHTYFKIKIQLNTERLAASSLPGPVTSIYLFINN